MRIDVSESVFDPWRLLAEYEAERPGEGKTGATATFAGTMRDFNEGDAVTGMRLEHYPGMTERELERIADEAVERWSLDDVLIHHRVGHLEPGAPIMLVAVWSAHRQAAFEGCRYIVEALKTRAPFWKKESLEEDERWVRFNTSG